MGHLGHCDGATMTMAPWLRRMLIESGRLTENGVSRNARIIIHTCGIPCIAGLDDDICAFETWCEMQPINTIGEAEALTQGRRTFEYLPANKRIYPRWTENITHRPAGTHDRWRQLVEHRCGELFPAHWADTRDDHQPEPTIGEESDECPF